MVAAPGLQSTGLAVAVLGLSRSMVYTVFLDQGSNLRLLHWQADSYLLHHQGNPEVISDFKSSQPGHQTCE